MNVYLVFSLVLSSNSYSTVTFDIFCVDIMALMLKQLYKGYFYAMNDLRDPRADDLPLMSSVWIPTIIGLTYLYIVLVVGPKFMENRAPFKLRKIIMAYNIFQVIINSFLAYHVIKESLTINWGCQPVKYATDPHNMFILRLVYLYFLIKLTDLLDTIFFVLRKKSEQISFLHTYHHVGMVIIIWFGVKFFGGGHSILVGFSNCIVHTVMYFYYFLRIWKPQYAKSIWWKKHITHLQLIQFMINIIIYGQLLFKTDCRYPKVISYFMVPQNIFFMCLFLDFYYKTYVKTKKIEPAEAVVETNQKDSLGMKMNNEMVRNRKGSTLNSRS